mmetsp:Transcript_4382/g.8888  ORF Transcript_4382/g.8888 Transcript_4382/m.8888 type:complete len:86 (+) Transcript_4382:120-377(+)|eukprot:CAMPEP_0170368040 /NCGR_PEP_ID=MMETSP0117_2-20130122/7241_1 /TAXON_ID=400756 /ORGANISM="Durinskia baltica, Strain CSIRO CS-38" /LENGTH=85 /DNA_ID=CAMNT_0010622673 /DNA_START=115 /DNA_END=372 /DNA_ORIENTATION=-
MMKHFPVAAMCVLGGGLMFSIPYFIQSRTQPLERKDGKLTGTQRQRGLYMNAGNQDAGIDPDWDPVTRRWTGDDKRKAINKKENT